jgi:hypothetical protein
MDLDVELLDVHREGEFRAEAWTAIAKVIPDGAVKFVVVEQRTGGAATPFDTRLLPLIREGQSVADLLLSLHATDFFLHHCLALSREDMLVRGLSAGGCDLCHTASTDTPGLGPQRGLEPSRSSADVG